MISLLAVGVIALTSPTTQTHAAPAPSPNDAMCAASAFWIYVKGDESDREASYPAFTFFIGKLSARSDAWEADFRAELEKNVKLEAARHAAILKACLPRINVTLDRATTFEKAKAR